MDTIYNAATGAATVAKEAVWGKDETAEQAEKSGEEPRAGQTGSDTTGEPYDKGNLDTPLASPTSPVAPSIPTVSVTPGTATSGATTSGAAVGNASLIPDATAPKLPSEEATPAAAMITTPEAAEAAIKKDAAAAEGEQSIPQTKAGGDAKSNTDAGVGGKLETKRAEIANKIEAKTPTKAGPSAAEQSPSSSKTSDKKRLSTKLKEKLHIGSKKNKE